MSSRQPGRIRAEERSQGCQIRQFAGVERSGKLFSQFTLAATIMSQRQQFDGNLASLFVRQLLDENVEGSTIFQPGKELVAIDEIPKRHRLLAQGMNDVPVV